MARNPRNAARSQGLARPGSRLRLRLVRPLGAGERRGSSPWPRPLRENDRTRAARDGGSFGQYQIADLEHLVLPEASFGFAYSSLAFHYIEDFDRLVRTIHRSLLPGSHFVFTIEHPVYMAPTNPGWSTDAEGRRIWPLDRYSVEGKRVTDWLAKGVVKYHRTLGTTLNTLIAAGFAIRRVQEWSPTADEIARNPDLAEEVDRPMMLLVAAQR